MPISVSSSKQSKHKTQPPWMPSRRRCKRWKSTRTEHWNVLLSANSKHAMPILAPKRFVITHSTSIHKYLYTTSIYICICTYICISKLQLFDKLTNNQQNSYNHSNGLIEQRAFLISSFNCKKLRVFTLQLQMSAVCTLKLFIANYFFFLLLFNMNI